MKEFYIGVAALVVTVTITFLCIRLGNQNVAAASPAADSYWTIYVTNANVWYNNTGKLDPIRQAMMIEQARTRPYWIELSDPPLRPWTTVHSIWDTNDLRSMPLIILHPLKHQ